MEPTYPHSILMQESKDMREKNIEPDIYRKLEVKVTCHRASVLDHNPISHPSQPTDVMWQNRHIFPQQNHAFFFARFSVYAWYIPCISQAYANVTNMPGICVVYPCIYMVYPMSWIYIVYPRIYHVYPQRIYMVYPCICMVYLRTYIHGIYVVYS